MLREIAMDAKTPPTDLILDGLDELLVSLSEQYTVEAFLELLVPGLYQGNPHLADNRQPSSTRFSVRVPRLLPHTYCMAKSSEEPRRQSQILI
jgi:hypothetical protein